MDKRKVKLVEIMVDYFCDLCSKECNERIFALPIASTFIGREPWDVMPVSMNLCKECKRKIYKAIETVVSKDRLEILHKAAMDVHMGR